MSSIPVWVGAFQWKLDNGLYVLVQDVMNIDPSYKGGIQIKLPGGMYEKEKDNTFLDTLRRELEEETHQVLLPGEYKSGYDWVEVEVRKIIYPLRSDCLSGDLRKDPITDGSSLLGPPRWFRVSDLHARFIYKTQRKGFTSLAKQLTAEHHDHLVA